MKIYSFLYLFLLFPLLPAWSQETSAFLRDSIYIDRGIPGTTAFEPESRIYFSSYDDRGRILEQIRERMGQNGQWLPQSRQIFTYDGDRLVELHLQLWSINNQLWLDQRRDRYRFENDRRVEFLRQKASQGQLTNDRRWTYFYNEEGMETGTLLEQWTGNAWENLSRKIVSYNEQGELSRQELQVWMNETWREVRARLWEYETVAAHSRVAATRVQIWSVSENDWIDQLRKVFLYSNEGRWVSSRFEKWQENAQEWVNTDRMVYTFDNQNRPSGQFYQVWDGDWENRGQVSYAFQNDRFLSRIETWDKVNNNWRNFLRYEVNLDDRNLLATRTGMQTWNGEQMNWENEAFTQQVTYFWSENVVNSVDEVHQYSACKVPNPYPLGNSFSCDLPPSAGAYQLELYDLLGKPVYRSVLQSGEAIAIDQRPAPGMYVLRIHDQQELFHIQRLIIP